MRRVLAATIVAFALVAARGAGTDFVVNTNVDPASPDDSCTGNAGGCTLRDAIDDAGPADRVIVQADTYNLTQGPLLPAGDNIVGAGPRATVIDAGGTAKVLYITAGTNSVSGVTLRNGGGVAIQAPASGGAVLVTSSVAPTSLTMTNVAVTGSHSAGDGGGIASVGLDAHADRLNGVGQLGRLERAGFGGGIAVGGPERRR